MHDFTIFSLSAGILSDNYANNLHKNVECIMRIHIETLTTVNYQYDKNLANINRIRLLNSQVISDRPNIRSYNSKVLSNTGQFPL